MLSSECWPNALCVKSHFCSVSLTLWFLGRSWLWDTVKRYQLEWCLVTFDHSSLTRIGNLARRRHFCTNRYVWMSVMITLRLICQWNYRKHSFFSCSPKPAFFLLKHEERHAAPHTTERGPVCVMAPSPPRGKITARLVTPVCMTRYSWGIKTETTFCWNWKRYTKNDHHTRNTTNTTRNNDLDGDWNVKWDM